jgi:hypothetical protein
VYGYIIKTIKVFYNYSVNNVGGNPKETTSEVISRTETSDLKDSKEIDNGSKAGKCVSFAADVSADEKRSYADVTRGASVESSLNTFYPKVKL